MTLWVRVLRPEAPQLATVCLRSIPTAGGALHRPCARSAGRAACGSHRAARTEHYEQLCAAAHRPTTTMREGQQAGLGASPATLHTGHCFAYGYGIAPARTAAL
eukprot:scaffold22797_cov33-Phaeocystis_antarctica.AAC.1